MPSLKQDALRLHQLGWTTLPGGPDRSPRGRWKKYQDKTPLGNQVEAWFESPGTESIVVVCGEHSGIAVLDIDSHTAYDWWREQLGPEPFESGVIARTQSGMWHIYFATDGPVASRAMHDGDMEWDVKADGSIVIAPPTPGYSWEDGREPWNNEMLPAPELVRDPPRAAAPGAGGGQVRSQLTYLLEHPPEGEGGRNVWLTRVAGHYAKQFVHAHDAYEHHVRQAVALMDQPLGEAEVRKTIDSIWRAEHDKPSQALTEANGWLMEAPDGRHILCQTRFKDGDGEWITDTETWGHFAIRATAVTDPEDAEEATYLVDLYPSNRDTALRDQILYARTLGSRSELKPWLAARDCVVMPPDAMWPRSGSLTERLQLYLQSQDPPRFDIVSHLGWSKEAGGFVTPDGVITSRGKQPFASIRPDPRIAKVSDFRYGTEIDREEAAEALREVLTFHHTETAAVYGSWWAAAIVRPMLEEHTSMFPLMAIEAPSESGKTSGMFNLLVQMSGNARGQTIATKASFRDTLTANSGGIAWIDDPDNLEPLLELLRAATGEGTITKKAEDHVTNVEAHLVSPIMISGEGLQLHHEKALRDRTVRLAASSPAGRLSLKGDYPQWDDIVDFKLRYRDLTAMAGTLVSMVVEAAEEVAPRVQRLRSSGSRRHGEKLAIVRAGSRILSKVTGDPNWAHAVDHWIDQQEDTGAENALTLEIIPRFIDTMGPIGRPMDGVGDWPATPVLVNHDPTDAYHGVWVAPGQLAAWWHKHRAGRASARTADASAIEAQLRAMGTLDSKRIRVGGDPNHRPTYYRLPWDVAERFLDMAGPE